jgi:hypothetical protein
MKNLLVSFIILWFLVPYSNSQTKNPPEKVNSLQGGRWAVQFQVGSNFTLNSFEGATVYLKTHFSPRLALRLGVGVSGSYDDQKLNYQQIGGSSGTDIQTKNNSLGVTVTMKLLYYFNPKSMLNVYLGLGPVGTYSYTYDERFNPNISTINYTESDYWSGGLNGVLGCEFFPLRFLSFLAEYSVTAAYGKSTFKNTENDYYTGETREYYNTENTDLNLIGNTVRFGLSLYF